jgi:hypothetical protein
MVSNADEDTPMRSSPIFIALVVICQSFLPHRLSPAGQVQAQNAAMLPRPAAGLTVGTWRYQSRDDIPANPNLINDHSTFSAAIKQDSGSWIVTTAWEFPQGPVTDILTLDKGTLALRKEVFMHFLHPDQRWKPIEVDADLARRLV